MNYRVCENHNVENQVDVQICWDIWHALFG